MLVFWRKIREKLSKGSKKGKKNVWMCERKEKKKMKELWMNECRNKWEKRYIKN